MNNVSIIIPIHEYNDVVSYLLNRAIESIIKQSPTETILPDVILVYPTSIDDVVKKNIRYINPIITYLPNDGNSDYQSQVNLAVKSVNTNYFTVLEFDDELSIMYIKNAEKYIQSYPEIDIFLSMMIETNEKNEGLKLTNETVWAQQFVGENGEMGYLNLTSIKQFTDFKLSGAIIKKIEFENLGGYKSNIKLTFMYEFLLRALNNTCKIFTIPKIGYKHFANREGSLFDLYSKNMPMNERKFWFETALKEYNFINDRIIDTSLILKK
jgi:hypothetical protein